MDHSLRANLRLRDFYDIKPYLKKTKTRLKIVAKKGFPFWCHRHPKLKWFLCFCLCLICIGIYSLNFVWNIRVKGNTTVSTQAIIECLQQNEVEIGLKRKDIDCSGIELLLREQFHQLGWVSVYFEHTNLCIEVRESLYDTMEHSEVESAKMYNFVADKDAIISSIVTRAGKAMVKEGSQVKAGDILVLGQNEIFDDNGELKETLYFKADALVYGDVVYDFVIPFSEMEIMSLKLAGTYDDSALLRLGSYKLSFVLNKMEDAVILDKDISLEKDEKNICFRAKIYVREQIGINIPVEDVGENEFE